jgi:hypothetical protein
MTALSAAGATQVARPLNILVPLIKEDLRQGREASDRAGMPYYRAAGEKMIEAKPQIKRGEFGSWIKRNFQISSGHAQNYMALARATAGAQKSSLDDFSSLEQFRRDHLGHNRPTPIHRPHWHDPVKEGIERAAAIRNLHTEELKRADEREAQRKLALQLIDIGYKVLASKLHPDKGGSREAMARLNQVRDRLKANA